MREVTLAREALSDLHEHAVRAYPDECCGFLIGGRAEGTVARRPILRVAPAVNRTRVERDRRFAIGPQDVAQLEGSLEGTPETLVGFYHSHPDSPAEPSRLDEANAWPWYTYLVLAVEAGRARDVAAFELEPDFRHFRRVDLTVQGRAACAGPV